MPAGDLPGGGSECKPIEFDLFQAIAHIKCTFNNLQAAGDCQTTRKYAEGGHLTGDFAGEE
jgi:hypothetical protein